MPKLTHWRKSLGPVAVSWTSMGPLGWTFLFTCGINRIYALSLGNWRIHWYAFNLDEDES